VHKDDRELVKTHYSKRINNIATAQQYSFRGVHKDGSILYLEVITSLISYNNLPATIGTLVDITQK